jgi:hypothetical protein
VVTVEDVRQFVGGLPRAYEAYVRGRVKFRVGDIVFCSFSSDETVMGFGFPKEWRTALVDGRPDTFMLPDQSDLRFNWVHVRTEAIEVAEMRELVLDAWAMCVPKRVAREWAVAHPADT